MFELEAVRPWSAWGMQWDAGKGGGPALGGALALQAREARVAVEGEAGRTVLGARKQEGRAWGTGGLGLGCWVVSGISEGWGCFVLPFLSQRRQESGFPVTSAWTWGPGNTGLEHELGCVLPYFLGQFIERVLILD